MFGPRRKSSIWPVLGVAVFLALVLVSPWATAVRAQEVPFTDSLEPGALEEDALEPDALDEDALGLESFDSELFRQRAQMEQNLPLALIPPRPRQAIPMYFCWSCWEWHPGYGGGPARVPPSGDDQRINGIYYPAAPSMRVPKAGDTPVKKVKAGEKKQL